MSGFSLNCKKGVFAAKANAVPQTDAFQTIMNVVPNSKRSAKKNPVNKTKKLFTIISVKVCNGFSAFPEIILNCSPKIFSTCSCGSTMITLE